jgi:hypothetical protein
LWDQRCSPAHSNISFGLQLRDPRDQNARGAPWRRRSGELLALHEESKAAGLIAALIQDAGLTEFGGVPTYTALAVGPDRADRVDAITGALPLL